MTKNNTQVELVPDTEARKEFGNPCKMTWFRWEQEQPNFPPAIRINRRKFRTRDGLEAYKQSLIRKAMASRAA